MVASKLYTPMQIRAGSFLGGPIASIFFLRENFRTLDRAKEARVTLAWGSAFVVVLLGLLPFLPNRFPNYVIPLAYSYAAGAIASKWQLEKEAIVDSGIYRQQSNWRVCGIALLFLAAFVLVAFVELFSLDSLGLIDS